MENDKALYYVWANRYFVIAMFTAYIFMLSDMLLDGVLSDIARQILLAPILLIPLVSICHTMAWFLHLGHHSGPNMRKARIVLTTTMLIPFGYAFVHIPWPLS